MEGTSTIGTRDPGLWGRDKGGGGDPELGIREFQKKRLPATLDQYSNTQLYIPREFSILENNSRMFLTLNHRHRISRPTQEEYYDAMCRA